MPSVRGTRTRTACLLSPLLLTALATAGLGLPLAAAGAAHAATVTLEAESAVLSGGVRAESEHPGFTGSGYVGGFTDGNKGSASVAFAVPSASAGTGSVAIRYANGTGGAQTLSLYANGSKVRQISLPATANWDTWGMLQESLPLAKGANTVTLSFTTTDSGNVNIDRLTPTTPTTEPTDPPVTLTHQAETAFASGGPTVAGSAGSGGTGYLTGFTTPGARAVFSVSAPAAGTRQVAVRYRTPGANAATVTLHANGSPVRRLTLPATSGAWATLTTDAPLRAPLNTLTLRTEAGDNGDFQLDGVDVTGSTPNAARGATLPYTTYEAEAGVTNASVTAADRTYKTLASEASGRRAVVLDQTGEYVQFTLTKATNAVTVRYSMPDNAAGTGTNATLSLYADGTHTKDLALTSKYSWVYGAYPYGNDPSQGEAHRFFDETRTLTGTFPAGTVLKFQKDAGDTAASYAIDLVETETAPDPAAMPGTGFVSATTLGVTPNDGSDDTAALNSALATVKGQGKGLWLPAGTYDISGHVDLAGNVLRGAGEWHTTLRGKNGKGGLFGRGGTNTVQDLTLNGGADHRDDANSDAAVEGDFGNGSTLQNVWIQHSKVGLWIDAPTRGLLATGLRIRDTYADGVNLHKGTSGSEVSQSSVRNTGDDALAMWSEASAVTDCVLRLNTVQLPLLANGAAIYGGSGNRIEDNLIADTVTGASGIAVSTRFGIPFSGPATVQRNTLSRTGGYEPNWQSKLGALWVYADASEITTPVLLQDNDILDSTYSGLLVSWQKNVSDLTVKNNRIAKTGNYGIEINAAGSGTFSGVTVTEAASGGLSLAGGFTVNRGAGNSGW
ncbi:CBM35 domain-containing protein [Streptomyces sp. NPDC087917]|uniref:carbohydrate-binding protein n=1 Tax=Streptomyces sp. NPDC087917 TaxID=3155060 RepID=UPI00342FD8CB